MKKMFVGAAFNGLEFLTKETGADEYIEQMKVAQEFASINRKIMMIEIVDGFFQTEIKEEIESVHNYIDFEDNIIRKGATSAKEGQKVIIPFNMRDGIAIAVGKGNKDWNYSSPHGAGRILSRTKAKEQIELKDYQESMKDIYSTCVNQHTLDESPMVYKDTELIKSLIEPTVEIKHMIKPIYNFKGY